MIIIETEKVAESVAEEQLESLGGIVMKTKERLLRLCTICTVGICLTGCGSAEKAEESPVTSEQEKTSETVKETQANEAAENEGTDAWKYTLQCIDAVQGTALSDAEVCILDENGRETTKGKTDGQGMATMELAEGSYQVEVKKDGYYVEQSTVSVGAEDQTDRIRLVSAFEDDRYLVMLEWEGDADLDLLMYDADKDHYIGQGNPIDDNGSFLYADNDAGQGYELFSAAKAEGVCTFYVKDRQGVAEASSRMEAEGVTAKIYVPEGLVETIQADSEENAALWIPFYLYQGEVQVQDEYVHNLNERRKVLYDQEAIKAYQAFLSGMTTAVNRSDNQQYSMLDLMRQVESSDEFEHYSIENISYAYMDIGNDHMPEMQVLFEGSVSGTGMTFGCYYVLAYQDMELRILNMGWSEYRSGTDINYYGFIYSGGSDGAAIEETQCSILGADGKRKELYDAYYYFYGADRGEIDGLEDKDIEIEACIIDGKRYLTCSAEQEISSADREKCMQYVSREDFYFWSDNDGSAIKEVTEEELDDLIDQKAEKEGVLDLWKAQKSGETPELEWHEWQLPTGRQEGVEVWKYNYLMLLKDISQATEDPNNLNYYFSLEDLNNDGKMELMSDEPIFDMFGELIDSFPAAYTYDADGVQQLSLSSIGAERYDPDKGYIISRDMYDQGESYGIYLFDGTDAEYIVGLDAGEDGTGDYYKIMNPSNGDRIMITKEEYDSLEAQYHEPNCHWRHPNYIEATIENIENTFNVNIINRYGDWIITSR